jgi:hypothetical protein
MLFKARRIDFVSGSVETRDLNQIPAKAPDGRPWEIRAILFKVNIVELAAAVSDAIAADQWSTILQSLELRDNTGKPFLTDNPITGRAVRKFHEYVMRRNHVDPALVAANSNTTNTRQLVLTLNLRHPFLKEPDDHMKLAAQLRGGEVRFGWCIGTLGASPFGVGHTVQATTFVEVLLDLVPARTFKAKPSLFYGTKIPDTFDRYKLPVVGKILTLGLFRLQNTGAVIGATDFVDVEARGNELDINRQSFDNLAHEYNSQYLEDTASAKAVQSGGAADDVPLYMYPRHGSLAEVPTETEPNITLTVGAGNPALTTVAWGYCISKPVDIDHFSTVVETSKELPITRQGILAAVAADDAVKGADGNMVSKVNPVRGWLPKLINVGVAKSQG